MTTPYKGASVERDAASDAEELGARHRGPPGPQHRPMGEKRKEAVSAAGFQKARKSLDFGDRGDFADDRPWVLRTAGQGLGPGLSALCGAAAWC